MAPSTSAPWADTPFDLAPNPRYTDQKADPKTIFSANEMAISHNIYIRGLNAIYNQAAQVTTVPDIKDFLTFCQIWIEIIHHHHTLEEEIMFPRIERDLGKEGILKENLEQYHQFESAMEEFKGYVERVGQVGEGYEATVLKGLVDKFGNLLVRHLHEEISNLLQIRKEFNTSGETRHHPFIFGCRDATFEDGVNGNWPADVPFFIPYVISGVLSRKIGAGVWRFLPGDFHGKRRALPFV